MTNDLTIMGARPVGETTPRPLVIRSGSLQVGGIEDGSTIDGSGLIAAPGFIDLQINGAFGHDFTADPTSIWEVASQLPAHGVTAFLPTIVSSSPEIVRVAQTVLAYGPPPNWIGAVPLGLHCEGPMISPSRSGAHPPRHLAMPSKKLIAAWGGLDHIRMVTIAPELPGAESMIRHLSNDGVVVSLGHSDADHATAAQAFEWGAAAGTHIHNAMSGLHHRTPGLAAAVMSHPKVMAGLIADGVHVHPAMVAITHRALGPRLLLVTDAMAAMGEGDGAYRLGDVDVVVTGPRVEVAGTRTLAGSVLTMPEAVKNLAHFAGITLDDALVAATAAPARLLGDRSRGSLPDGARGDVVLMDPHGRVITTVIGGVTWEANQ